MNRVKFLNMLQLKIIEEIYNVSSLYQADKFQIAFTYFLEKKGPQQLRKALDNWELRAQYYLDQKHEYTHEELCEIKKELYTLIDFKNFK
jgi:hypothetical protein